MIEIKQMTYLTCDICTYTECLINAIVIEDSPYVKSRIPEDWKKVGRKHICPKHDVKILIDGKEL